MTPRPRVSPPIIYLGHPGRSVGRSSVHRSNDLPFFSPVLVSFSLSRPIPTPRVCFGLRREIRDTTSSYLLFCLQVDCIIGHDTSDAFVDPSEWNYPLFRSFRFDPTFFVVQPLARL